MKFIRPVLVIISHYLYSLCAPKHPVLFSNFKKSSLLSMLTLKIKLVIALADMNVSSIAVIGKETEVP